VLFPLLHGCQGPVDIKGEDRNVFLPTGRVSVDFLRGYDGSLADIFAGEASAPADQAAGSEKPKPVFRPSLGIDLDYTHGKGSSSQELEAGQYIDFGRRYFGPGEVRHEYTLDTGSLCARGGGWVAGIVGVEGILGVNVSRLALEVKTPTWRERDDYREVGGLLGGQVSVRPLAWLRFNARAATVIPEPLDMAELNAEFSPLPGLGLLAGWQWWYYDKARDGSDIDLAISGPMVGLHLSF
jgi:hypothetical protein